MVSPSLWEGGRGRVIKMYILFFYFDLDRNNAGNFKNTKIAGDFVFWKIKIAGDFVIWMIKIAGDFTFVAEMFV